MMQGILPQFGGIFAGAKNPLPLGMALGCAIGVLSICETKKEGLWVVLLANCTVLTVMVFSSVKRR